MIHSVDAQIVNGGTVGLATGETGGVQRQDQFVPAVLQAAEVPGHFLDVTLAGTGQLDLARIRFRDIGHVDPHMQISVSALRDVNGIETPTDHYVAYVIVTPNSFAYNPARINVGSIGYYAGEKNVIVSSLYEVFKTTDTFDDQFFWQWLKSDMFPMWVGKLQEGSVRQYFYYDKLCECEMLLPSLPEQQAIAEVLSSADEEISLLQRDLEQEKLKKKSLMQLLLTGLVRV